MALLFPVPQFGTPATSETPPRYMEEVFFFQCAGVRLNSRVQEQGEHRIQQQ